MERFGICVVSSDGQMDELAQSLQKLIAQWHLDASPDKCQVGVTLRLGQPSLSYGLGGGRGIRRLATMLSKVTQLPARRAWSGIDGSIIEIRFSRALMPSSQLLERIAWVLFLWSASSHVDHEVFRPLYGPVENIQLSPNIRPTSQVVLPVTYSSTVTQPLPRPRHANSAGFPASSATNPPPVKPKSKGG
ncbi:MAG: hypothetical protein M1499_07505 [Firmicutes bacterium]|jgi:hypothetical protein|nr:hypothetical protein [Bacillota bacterium]